MVFSFEVCSHITVSLKAWDKNGNIILIRSLEETNSFFVREWKIIFSTNDFS